MIGWLALLGLHGIRPVSEVTACVRPPASSSEAWMEGVRAEVGGSPARVEPLTRDVFTAFEKGVRASGEPEAAVLGRLAELSSRVSPWDAARTVVQVAPTGLWEAGCCNNDCGNGVFHGRAGRAASRVPPRVREAAPVSL